MNWHQSVHRSCVFGFIPGLVLTILVGTARPSLAADNIVPLASSGTLAISDVTVSKTQVARYETVELTFRMVGQWQNPFDPDEVCVDAALHRRRRRTN